MFAHEMFPGALMPGGAATREGEVFQMQGGQVPLERARIWLDGKGLLGTSLERRRKTGDRHGPPIRPRHFIQARDESVREPPSWHAFMREVNQ